MNTNKKLKDKSIWKPKFIEAIDRDICLNCDRFNEAAAFNGLMLHSINKDSRDVEQKVITINHPEQHADCEICTRSYTEKFYTQYSFSA
ncbi:MAG: hypothetical protein ACFCAD_00830 [Pleurocapsa sp.]